MAGRLGDRLPCGKVACSGGSIVLWVFYCFMGVLLFYGCSIVLWGLTVTLHLIPCTLYLAPYTLYLVPYTLYLVPCTLYLVPCTLYLVPRLYIKRAWVRVRA